MLVIGEVLTAEDVERVRQGLPASVFSDGKRTARGAARSVKANSQADGADPKVKALARFVRAALERSTLFQLHARPARWAPVMFNRYGPGDAYGLHIDDPVMGGEDGPIRTDLSFTLFLSDPETYEGGELVIDDLDGERAAKPPAGSVVVYSTGAPHRVAEITSGERLAAVGWVQSLIRRPDEREVLFDLGRVRAGMGTGEEAFLMDKAIAALIRLWGEP